MDLMALGAWPFDAGFIRGWGLDQSVWAGGTRRQSTRPQQGDKSGQFSLVLPGICLTLTTIDQLDWT
jgi:hypothetical protein